MSKYPKCDTFEQLEEKVKTYIKDENQLQLIKKAYEFANEKLSGKKRLNGDDAITHPLITAYILTTISADAETLSAALLGGSVEEEFDLAEKEFGREVIGLVKGVSKINKLAFNSKTEASIINQRKILVGLSEDVRVIIIKLACRLHNMQTLSALDEEKQKEISKETLEILTPIAHRLGINTIKTQLEEFSLRYLNPDGYYGIVEKLNATKKERDASVVKMINHVSDLLDKHNIKHEIKGRAKSIYSIYKKMDNGKRFNEIYDLLALRVFVNTEADCYQTLGIIHSKFKPKPNRFKDYIAMPKTNMYQSLHTTVFGVDGELFEIQIRTYEMDKIAEYGIASHWSYKESGSVKASMQNEMEQKLQFFRSIMELKANEENAEDFVNSVKEDILNKTIYAFTPAGDVIELPKGATPIDFAYKVHTDVGNTMTGVLVNSAMVPLNYELEDNDIVKVITGKNGGPNYEWLKMIKTNQAKNKIKNFLLKTDKEENIKRGEDLLNKALKKNKIFLSDFNKKENLEKIFKSLKIGSLTELHSNVGSRNISVSTVIDIMKNAQIKEEKLVNQTNKIGQKISDEKNLISVAGIVDMKINLAACCNPIVGDEIIGYITKGNGVSVHQISCPNVDIKEERLIDVTWNCDKAKLSTNILIHTAKNKDSLIDIVSAAASNDVGIRKINNQCNNENSLIEIMVVVNNVEHLNKFINVLKMNSEIYDVERLIK